MDWCESCGKYSEHVVINDNTVCTTCNKRKKIDADKVIMAIDLFAQKKKNVFIFPENIGAEKLQKRIDMGFLVIPSSVV